MTGIEGVQQAYDTLSKKGWAVQLPDLENGELLKVAKYLLGNCSNDSLFPKSWSKAIKEDIDAFPEQDRPIYAAAFIVSEYDRLWVKNNVESKGTW